MTQDDVIPPDGKINAKLAGEITVAGLTTEEMEQALVKATADHLKNPEVVVSITRFSEAGPWGGSGPAPLPYRKGRILQAGRLLAVRIPRTTTADPSADGRIGQNRHRPQAQPRSSGDGRGQEPIARPRRLFVPRTESPTPTSGSASTLPRPSSFAAWAEREPVQ
jgi:hypothetical protein